MKKNLELIFITAMFAFLISIPIWLTPLPEPFVNWDVHYNQPVASSTPIILPTLPRGIVRTVSAYNAGDPAQTDYSPCTTASGQDACQLLTQGIQLCAANFVKFGTRLWIENFGECLVVDRMNKRYPNSVDIAMKKSEKKRALQFGRQKLHVVVIK